MPVFEGMIRDANSLSSLDICIIEMQSHGMRGDVFRCNIDLPKVEPRVNNDDGDNDQHPKGR